MTNGISLCVSSAFSRIPSHTLVIQIHVGGSPKAVCIVRADQNGVEFAVMRQHLDEESLPLIIVIIILLQSKTFDGPM